MGGEWAGEDDPHRVDAVVEGAGRICVDGDPLLVRLTTLAIVEGDVVRMAIVGRDPVRRSRRAMRAYCNRDDLGWVSRVRLPVRIDLEVMGSIGVVEELVGQDQLIVVPKAIESADRVGVIGPAFIAWNVPLDAPGLAVVKGLVESKQVVVTLGADEPLGGGDQVVRVSGVDADVGLRVIFDQHGSLSRIAGIAASLGGIWTKILTCGGSTVARRFAAIAIIGADVGEIWHLWCVATGLLRGRKHIRYTISCETVGVGYIGLGSLGNVAYSGVNRSCSCLCKHESGHKGEQGEQRHREISEREFTHVIPFFLIMRTVSVFEDYCAV